MFYLPGEPYRLLYLSSQFNNFIINYLVCNFWVGDILFVWKHTLCASEIEI